MMPWALPENCRIATFKMNILIAASTEETICSEHLDRKHGKLPKITL